MSLPTFLQSLQAVRLHHLLQMETSSTPWKVSTAIMKESNTCVGHTTPWRESLTEPASMVNGLASWGVSVSFLHHSAFYFVKMSHNVHFKMVSSGWLWQFDTVWLSLKKTFYCRFGYKIYWCVILMHIVFITQMCAYNVKHRAWSHSQAVKDHR